MQRLIGPSLAVLVALVATVAVAAELKSGLQPGEQAGPFNVKDVTGPRQGTSLCYR